MPLVVPRYTLSDLDSFPDDGNRYELLDGELLVTPAPAFLHQLVVARILRTLTEYIPSELAEVFTPGSVEVEPNVHLEPDLLVVPVSGFAGPIDPGPRWTSIRGWWLAVEVSGDGSRVYDRDHKVPAYIALGVRWVWRADLSERCVFVSGPGSTEQRHNERLTWHPPERPGPLLLSVPELFKS